MNAVLRLPGLWHLWILGAVVFVVFVVVAVLLISAALRKSLSGKSQAKSDESVWHRPGSQDPVAFMSASMQAVIQRLREQEKELARLHQLEKERALETERFSEAVTRNMPTGLLLINSAGLITQSNPAAESALGMGALAYRRYREVFGSDSDLTRLLSQCLAEGKTFHREEVEHSTSAGEVRRLGVTISPTRSVQSQQQARPERQARDKVSGALCLLSDLTQLTALQNEIRLQENLAALGEMSAGIAHEFKNALATISGYAQMILAEAPAGELADCARRIVEQTRGLTRVVTEFLRFARPLEVAQDTVHLRSVVKRVIEEVREAIPEVAICAEGEFAEMAGDEGLLRQALLNLARNAAEAARERGTGGSVAVRGAVEEKAGEVFQRVAVADNGPGIPSEDFNKIFLPFYTTKPDGTGLGLAVVQKIVLQHGGRVEARNQPGGGAEFVLWLPLRRPVPSPTVESASSRI